jgi:transposase
LDFYSPQTHGIRRQLRNPQKVRPLDQGAEVRVAYTRFETEPGLQAQVDWGDFTVIDASGKTTTVFAFVMLLGYSRAMYVEFVERCTLETFMDCKIRAFSHLGGVPAEDVPRPISGWDLLQRSPAGAD